MTAAADHFTSFLELLAEVLDDHEATAVSDVVFLLKGDEGWAVTVVGRYHDVLHHDTDGTWRFHRREATFL